MIPAAHSPTGRCQDSAARFAAHHLPGIEQLCTTWDEPISCFSHRSNRSWICFSYHSDKGCVRSLKEVNVKTMGFPVLVCILWRGSMKTIDRWHGTSREAVWWSMHCRTWHETPPAFIVIIRDSPKGHYTPSVWRIMAISSGFPCLHIHARSNMMWHVASRFLFGLKTFPETMIPMNNFVWVKPMSMC